MIGGVALRVVLGVRRIVAQFLVFDQVPHHTHPKPIHTLAQPEPHNLCERGVHVRIAPVQIGLAHDLEG